jgi:hypothetical protein
MKKSNITGSRGALIEAEIRAQGPAHLLPFSRGLLGILQNTWALRSPVWNPLSQKVTRLYRSSIV